MGNFSDPPSRHLPQTLRAYMAAQGWSLDELARATDMPPSTLSQIIRGDTPMSINTFGSIASAFGLTPAELYHAARLTAQRKVA